MKKNIILKNMVFGSYKENINKKNLDLPNFVNDNYRKTNDNVKKTYKIKLISIIQNLMNSIFNFFFIRVLTAS